MCGIVGYIGKDRPVSFLLNTLNRLEYRGYDSCGVALRLSKKTGKVFLKKTKGKNSLLAGKIDPEARFYLGIAHTRWATHGVPSTVNAHPHTSCDKEIFLVHNGIIENYKELKAYLIKRGHRFVSQTDTEVIPHLMEEFLKEDGVTGALFKTVHKLKGSFALVLFSVHEEVVLFARKESPLVLGTAKNGFIIASDIPALYGQVKDVFNLQEESIGIIRRDGWENFKFNGQRIIPRPMEKTRIVDYSADKKGYPHFMIKEIFEQPGVLRKLYSSYTGKGGVFFKDLGRLNEKNFRSLNKIFIFACGTAFHAGYVGKYFLERHAKVDVEIDVASEARYRAVSIKENDLVIAISQSGETADMLASIREAKLHGARVLGICNVPGSTLTREADGVIYTMAGPEIGVASTKAYTAQVFCLFLFAMYLVRIKKILPAGEQKAILEELKQMSAYQEKVLESFPRIKKIAKKFSRFGCFLFLGRGINYPSALEGALKLKEISYIPAEGYPAGEIKHGPIALIDEYRAVVCLAPRDSLYDKVVSNIQEIKARKGKVLGIFTQGDKEAAALSDDKIYLPELKHQELTPLLVAIPLQAFAYFVALNLGCEIDQPRNLAKSVTVE